MALSYSNSSISSSQFKTLPNHTHQKKKKTNKFVNLLSLSFLLVWQEEEKSKLSVVTGLDQKQINNWFINQRKRHWKPPEDMRFVLMDGAGAGAGAGECIKGSNFYDNGETGGHVIWHDFSFLFSFTHCSCSLVSLCTSSLLPFFSLVIVFEFLSDLDRNT